MQDQVTREIELEHPIDTVWKAITNSDDISEWFMKTDFKAEVGAKYTYHSDAEDCEPIHGIVKSADPYELVYTWIVEGTEVETLVTWTLEDQGSSTKLRLTHAGISNYGAEMASKMFESYGGGWDNCFEGLTKHLSAEVHVG